ncbi:putative glycoside hydrolase family 16 protein [Lyophyllum shimeji]|uniref:Glycoside hydrolase family 16 protein n=1 Tax=Lyophyllum shimeji TaxID=47721 RepID=A0A9P3PU98_LYOSH|nr:putative glycoside hydrolase family 16 protein [Lyophyllum shimeji]
MGNNLCLASRGYKKLAVDHEYSIFVDVDHPSLFLRVQATAASWSSSIIPRTGFLQTPQNSPIAMFNLPTVLLFGLSIFSLANETAAAGRRTDARRSRQVARQADSKNQGAGKAWKQVDRYEGHDFLAGWDFFNKGDPTHGLVNYVDAETAQEKHLAKVEDGQVILAADDTTVLRSGDKRDSVRISTKKTYNGGLFIADIAAMPVGCGIWPAYWSVGPDWPNGGEIDILEGVHNQDTNQYTLHTAAGCSLNNAVKTTSRVLGTTCASSGADNTGCAFRDTDARSYGHGFNGAGGGVYAHLWDSAGIKIWHFARSEIPQDIKDGKPDPSKWPTPAAQFAASSCDVGKYFHDNSLVFDTTFCGDWAGATYASAGCPGTCAERVADPKNFQDAKWKINYVAVYQLD